MSNEIKVTTEAKLKEIKRELDLRKNCYPKWILQGRMTQSVADKHIAIMEAIYKDYQEKAKQEDPQMSLL